MLGPREVNVGAGPPRTGQAAASMVWRWRNRSKTIRTMAEPSPADGAHTGPQREPHTDADSSLTLVRRAHAGDEAARDELVALITPREAGPRGRQDADDNTGSNGEAHGTSWLSDARWRARSETVTSRTG